MKSFNSKAFVAVAFLAVATNLAHAQRIGITAGATFSNVRTSTDLNLSNRTGSTFGVSLQLPLGETFTLQPELLFINKGSKFSSTSINGNFRLDYVEVPLLLRYDISRGAIGPHVYAGPSVGFNVGCNVSGTLTSSAVTSTDCTKDNFKPKSLDYGITVGGGVDFNLGGLAATGGVRYGIGLADIRSDNSAEFRDRVHNGVLSLYVGLLFGKLAK
ncbi:MAG: porin family protein [Gemmatimonadaceae bacterium]